MYTYQAIGFGKQIGQTKPETHAGDFVGLRVWLPLCGTKLV